MQSPAARSSHQVHFILKFFGQLICCNIHQVSHCNNLVILTCLMESSVPCRDNVFNLYSFLQPCFSSCRRPKQLGHHPLLCQPGWAESTTRVSGLTAYWPDRTLCMIAQLHYRTKLAEITILFVPCRKPRSATFEVVITPTLPTCVLTLMTLKLCIFT